MQNKMVFQINEIDTDQLSNYFIEEQSHLNDIVSIVGCFSSDTVRLDIFRKYMEKHPSRNFDSATTYCKMLSLLPKPIQLEFVLTYSPVFQCYPIDVHSEQRSIDELMDYFRNNIDAYKFILTYKINFYKESFVKSSLKFLPNDQILPFLNKYSEVFEYSSNFVEIVLNVKNDEIFDSLIATYFHKYPWLCQVFFHPIGLLEILARVKLGVHLSYEQYDKHLLDLLMNVTFMVDKIAEAIIPDSKFIMGEEGKKEYLQSIENLITCFNPISHKRFEEIKQHCKSTINNPAYLSAWQYIEDKYHQHKIKSCKEQAGFFFTAKKSQTPPFKDLPRPLIYKIISDSVNYPIEKILPR